MPTATVAATGATGEVTTWYYFDQSNTDPKANERVGNLYIAKSLKQFNDEMQGKLTWNNVPHDYNLMLDLVTAVQNGGDAPDVMQFGIVDLPLYMLNNTIQDVEWIRNEAWFKDLDPKSVEACTVNGKLYCVPISESPWLTYYWTDIYKEGFPKTPEDLLKAGAELKKNGNYALTFWGSTAFDGEAAGRYFFQAIASFGGSYDDGQGNLKLNTPENIKAVEFLRDVVKQGLASESVFAGNFEEEEAFKQGKAGAFPTSFFIAVRYLNPLKSAGGKDYQDIEAAVTRARSNWRPLSRRPATRRGVRWICLGLSSLARQRTSKAPKPTSTGSWTRRTWSIWIVNAGGAIRPARRCGVRQRSRPRCIRRARRSARPAPAARGMDHCATYRKPRSSLPTQSMT